MYEILRKVNFFLFTISLILEIISMIISILMILNTNNLIEAREPDSNNNDLKSTSLIILIISISLGLIAFLYITYIGIRSLYLKIICRLYQYLSFCVIYPLLFWVLVTYYFSILYKVNKISDKIDIYRYFIIITNISRSVIFCFSFILLIIECRIIKNNMKNSPLNKIDENLTKEQFDSILNNSKRTDPLANKTLFSKPKSEINHKSKFDDSYDDSNLAISNYQIKIGNN